MYALGRGSTDKRREERDLDKRAAAEDAGWRVQDEFMASRPMTLVRSPISRSFEHPLFCTFLAGTPFPTSLRGTLDVHTVELLVTHTCHNP